HLHGTNAHLPSQPQSSPPSPTPTSPSLPTNPDTTLAPPLPDPLAADQLYRQLHSTLEHERQLKKDAQTSLKKLRRDLNRSESQLRSETESLRRSFTRSPASATDQARNEARGHQLEDQISRLNVDTLSLADRAHSAHDAQVSLARRLDDLAKTHTALRLQHKRSERVSSRSGTVVRSAMMVTEARMAELDGQYAEVTATVQRVERMEGPNVAGRMADTERAVGVERARTARLERRRDEARVRSEETEVGREEEDRIRGEVDRLEARCAASRGTWEEEARFGEALKRELENFKREAVEGYFEYRGRGG
ncbi:hypothetical protein BC938DRAFT_477722, partial [Jimgerdemannia flammicorona]